MINLNTNIPTSDIQIYVADLAAYNAGHLHGVFIDATDDLDDIQDQINTMLASSPVEDAEEYAIHDYEGFEGCSIEEYEGIESAHEKALFIAEHGALGGLMLTHFCDDMEEARKALNDCYCGSYESLADYAQELTEDSTDIPAHLKSYIDYEKMGRDMEMGGGIYTIEVKWDEVHIFSNC